ncbi:terminase large subunit domain-containing protein [Microbacterium sp. CR_7]|uniref:terminase large subunit domain-containing protein n=1 Tax=Microbacterium sp. CR_7 TaxID=3055792 RepID=UPI0035C0BEAD
MTWTGFTYATQRDPSRPTRGAKIAELARMLGWEPMPWQQHVWDVATELDDRGNYVYEKVFVTVPRQSGKTTLFGPVELQRAVEFPGSKVYFTAQTGDDARTLLKTLISRVEQSPLKRFFDGKRSAAQTGMVTPRGSEIWAFPPKPEKIHGKTPVLVGIDEIWTLDDVQSKGLITDGIEPAQRTLFGKRQLWYLSTAGTAESTFMKRQVERGRRSVLNPGTDPRFAYFEASLPDDADPYDREAFAAFHPAIGYTQDVDDLFALVDGSAPPEEQVDHSTWLRAYCNRWTESKTVLIPDFAELADDTIGAAWSDVAIAWEVWVDDDTKAAAGAIVASWRDALDNPVTRVVHAAPGTQWMVDLLVKIHGYKPAAFGADNGGSTRRITDEVLRRLTGDDLDPDELEPKLRTLNGIERSVADETWLTAARDEQTLIHDGSKTLSNGVAHLVYKRTGEIHKFSRSHSTGPVAGPIASAVALWLYDHRDAATRAPVTSY